MAELHKVWVEQCEAMEQIEFDFRTQKAFEYLVGEKFLNFLEAAESDDNFRAEVPAFVAKIKSIFEECQLVQYLKTARETEPFDPNLFDGDDELDAEEVEDMRRDDERLNLVVERIKQPFDSIAAEMKSTQTFESAERREAAYKEMERYGLEASATIGCGRRPL